MESNDHLHLKGSWHWQFTDNEVKELVESHDRLNPKA